MTITDNPLRAMPSTFENETSSDAPTEIDAAANMWIDIADKGLSTKKCFFYKSEATRLTARCKLDMQALA